MRISAGSYPSKTFPGFRPLDKRSLSKAAKTCKVYNYVSLKTETGEGTDLRKIAITKLCTTEKDPWTAESLVERAMQHLSRYDIILMFRAVWELPVVHYQLVEIPVDLLKLMRTADFAPVGRRTGRKSLGADVFRGSEKVLHVHFDGSDGKCQVRDLAVSNCVMLESWDALVSG